MNIVKRLQSKIVVVKMGMTKLEHEEVLRAADLVEVDLALVMIDLRAKETPSGWGSIRYDPGVCTQPWDSTVAYAERYAARLFPRNDADAAVGGGCWVRRFVRASRVRLQGKTYWVWYDVYDSDTWPEEERVVEEYLWDERSPLT